MSIVILAAISIGQVARVILTSKNNTAINTSLAERFTRNTQDDDHKNDTNNERYNNRLFVLKLMDSMGMKADASMISRLEHRSHESILKEMIARKKGEFVEPVIIHAEDEDNTVIIADPIDDDKEITMTSQSQSPPTPTPSSSPPPGLLRALEDIKHAVIRIEQLWNIRKN